MLRILYKLFFLKRTGPEEVPAELSPRASGQISRAYVSAVLYCVRYQLPLYCQVPTAPAAAVLRVWGL